MHLFYVEGNASITVNDHLLIFAEPISIFNGIIVEKIGNATKQKQLAQ